MADGMSFGQMAGLGGIAAGGNLIGGVINHVLGSKQEKQMWQKNYDAQKEFAQNSIQWRVQDAEKAGIHPLYAMGNSPGYTPSSMTTSGGIGEGIANASNAFAQTMGQLQMQNAYLQNAKLSNEIESQRIANSSKEVELYNKALDTLLGQKPQTLPYVTDQGKTNYLISPGGYGYFTPDQVENEFLSLAPDMRNIGNSMYNRKLHEAVPTPKGYKKVIMWTPLGYSHKFVKSNKDLGILDAWGAGNDYIIEKVGDGVNWLIDKATNFFK